MGVVYCLPFTVQFLRKTTANVKIGRFFKKNEVEMKILGIFD